MRPVGRILGIDYGSRRIGLAMSDPMRIIAQGLTTLDHTNLDKTISEIKQITQQYDIHEAVIGYPLSLHGGTNATTEQALAFAKVLRDEIDINVTMLDERFTSKIAETTLKSLGRSPSKDRGRIDQLAAAFILQTYLDRAGAKKG